VELTLTSFGLETPVWWNE